MTTNPTPEPDETIPADFDFMAWLTSGTVATRTVEIHNDPALVAEFEALDRELKAVERKYARAGGDAPLDEDDPRPAILARMEELADRWDASKSLWTVRALSDDEVQATFDPEQGGIAVPRQPLPPLPAQGDKARERFVEKFADWERRNEAANKARRLLIIAAALESIESPQGRRERVDGQPAVTLDELRAMAARPHGETWITKLDKAVTAATKEDGEVPRPTSPGRSTTTQD